MLYLGPKRDHLRELPKSLCRTDTSRCASACLRCGRQERRRWGLLQRPTTSAASPGGGGGTGEVAREKSGSPAGRVSSTFGIQRVDVKPHAARGRRLFGRWAATISLAPASSTIKLPFSNRIPICTGDLGFLDRAVQVCAAGCAIRPRSSRAFHSARRGPASSASLE